MGAEELKLFIGDFCPPVPVKSNRWTLLFVLLIFHTQEALNLERKYNQKTVVGSTISCTNKGIDDFPEQTLTEG